MAQSDEWEFVEEWYGKPPDELLEGIKRTAKEHIAGVEKAVNSMDGVVRACKEWQRQVLLGLCPECRERKNYVKPKAECPTNTDKRHSSSRLTALRKVSGKDTSKIKDKDSPSVDINGQQSTDEMTRQIKDLQLLLKTKESAFKYSNQKSESENEKLKKDVEKLKKENELLQQRISSVDQDLEHAQKNINAEKTLLSREWEVTQKELTEHISDLTEQLNKQEKQIGELKNDLYTKDDELCMAKEELAEAKRPRLRDIVLGIRSKHRGTDDTKTYMVVKELLGQLQNALEREDIRMTVKLFQPSSEVSQEMMDVPCLDMSMFGTDTKDAQTGVEDEIEESHINGKKVIEVGLSSLHSGMGKTMTARVIKELQKRLQDRLAIENRDVHINHCQTLDDVTDGPLLILCLAESIIETKVNALEGVQANKNGMLIAIHYTDTQDDPPFLTRVQHLRYHSNEVRQLGGTIDMIFSSGSGLSNCDVNISAMEKMTSFLKKF